MSLLLLDFWNSTVNTLFRDIPDFLRYILIVVFLVLAFISLTKAIRMDKNADKSPLRYGYLILFALFFTFMMLYISIY